MPSSTTNPLFSFGEGRDVVLLLLLLLHDAPCFSPSSFRSSPLQSYSTRFTMNVLHVQYTMPRVYVLLYLHFSVLLLGGVFLQLRLCLFFPFLVVQGYSSIIGSLLVLAVPFLQKILSLSATLFINPVWNNSVHIARHY